MKGTGPCAIKTQLKARNAPCLELYLYGIRELASATSESLTSTEVEAGEEQEEGADYYISAGTEERGRFRRRSAEVEAHLGSDFPINCLVWNGIPSINFIINSQEMVS